MLRQEDTDFLNGAGYTYKVTIEAGVICLVVTDYTLPPGLVPGHADLLLRLPSGFPDATPDMFWMAPFVTTAAGADPEATQVREVHLEVTWQRWSRHLQPGEWNPGIDSLQSFFAYIRACLEHAAQAVAA